MNLILKVTTNFIDGITEIYEPLSMKYTDRLLNSGTMEFKVDTRSEYLNKLDLFQKIELFYSINSTQYSVWNGYISNINVKLPHTTIKCFSNKEYLKRKISNDIGTQTNKTPQEIIQALVAPVNAGLGVNEQPLTVASNITNTYTFKPGSGTLYSIIDKLATTAKAQWTMDKNQIIFRDRIGQDRLTSPDFIEVVSSVSNPMFNTLANVDVSLSSNTLVTKAYIKNSSGTVTRTGNTDTYGVVESKVTVKDGNLNEAADGYITKYSQPLSVYKVNIDDRSITLLDAYVGDSVWLRIEQNIPLIDTFEPYVIIEKSVDFKYGKPKLNFKFSNKNIDELNLEDVLGDMMDRIKGLENKI